MRYTRTTVSMLTGALIVAMVTLAIAVDRRATVLAFQAPPTDPVAQWQLDEQDGTATVADTSAYGNAGTVVDPNKWNVGVLNGALEFNGSSDYVRVSAPAGSSLRRPSIGYAISAWVRVVGTGPKGADVATMGDNYTLRIQPDGNVKTFFYSTTWRTHTTTGVNVKDGHWHHLVGQYDGTNVTVYVDGDQKLATAYPGMTIAYANGQDFYLGKHGNNGIEHTFAGFIDQVRVYDHGLSPAEIARLAAEPPVAHWKLDESDGSASAQDSAGANTGAVSDAQAWTTAGRVDGALTFSGSTNVTVASPTTTPAARSLQPLQGFAISAWVKADATGPNGGEIATMGDSYALRVQPNGNVKTFFHDGTTWRSQTASVDVLGDAQWHHLVGQYDGTTLEIYVDNVRFDGPDYPGATINYAGRGTSFRLGQHGNGSALYGLTGTIDQVRVYGRALTAAEIATLSQESGGGPVDPPTVTTFTVLTWNVHKCRDTSFSQTKSCARTAQDIQAVHPDVVLLSAVHTAQDASDIAAALGWPAPHYGSTAPDKEGQAIISRFPMDRSGDQYPPLVHLVHVDGATEDQVIVRATLNVAGRKVHFFAIDQDHQFPAARTGQANQFRAWAWAYKTDGLPMIVAGDFNTETGNGIAEWLVKPDPAQINEAFFDDWTRAESTSADTDPSGRTKRFRLDHMLSYRGTTGLETGAARVNFFRINTDCSQVSETLCKVDRGECTNACDSTWHEDGGVRASDHSMLSVDFRLPSGS